MNINHRFVELLIHATTTNQFKDLFLQDGKDIPASRLQAKAHQTHETFGTLSKKKGKVLVLMPFVGNSTEGLLRHSLFNHFKTI